MPKRAVVGGELWGCGGFGPRGPGCSPLLTPPCVHCDLEEGFGLKRQFREWAHDMTMFLSPNPCVLLLLLTVVGIESIRYWHSRAIRLLRMRSQ